MKEAIRKFALVVIDDFDQEVERFSLDYAETPKNLGFEMEFTTLESRLTTAFTSAKEKKLATTLTVNFLPPYAYDKVNAFRMFVQRNMNRTTVFEYNDTTRTLQWEGKVQKLGQEELADWGGLSCPISFLPSTPKYIRRDNAISINLDQAVGKRYPLTYPYAYARTIIRNNELRNSYFDEVPLRVFIYGKVTEPCIALADESDTVYTKIQIRDLVIGEGEHLVIDAIRSKILLWRDGKYTSAYDYVDKSSTFDTFLFAKGDTVSRIRMNLQAEDTGHLLASYRQYVL